MGINNKKIVLLLLMLLTSISLQAELPKDVQADIIEKRIYQFVNDKDYKGALDQFKKYHSLGVTMPPALLYFEAITATVINNPITAKKALDDYFQLINVKNDKNYEKALALKILQLEDVIDAVISECTPNLLCNYLYELASLYMSFYEACPILKEGIAEDVKLSRLALCQLISLTLNKGLDILGIEVMERM